MLEQVFKKMVFDYYIVFVLLVLTAIVGYFLQYIVAVDSFSKEGIALQTANILVLLMCIPTGLRMFSVKTRQLKKLEDEDQKLSRYLYWSRVRLTAVATPLLLSVLLHCVISSSDNNYSMIFCAGISAMALLFCKPAKDKVREELNII